MMPHPEFGTLSPETVANQIAFAYQHAAQLGTDKAALVHYVEQLEAYIDALENQIKEHIAP